MKKVVEKNKDIAFYIKLYPLPMHPAAYEKSKSVVCEQSLKALEDAFDGKALPKAKCDSREVDDNIKLVDALGVSSTPTMILPDGRVIPGYKDADALIKLIIGK